MSSILKLPDNDLLIPWPFESQDLTNPHNPLVKVFHGIVISERTAHISYVDLRARIQVICNLIDDFIPDHLRYQIVYVNVPLFYYKVLQPKMWNALDKIGKAQDESFSIEITSEMVQPRDINYERAIANAKLPTKRKIIQGIVDAVEELIMSSLPAGLHCGCQFQDGRPKTTTPHPKLKVSGHLRQLRVGCTNNGHGMFRPYEMDYCMMHCHEPVCKFLASATTMRLCSVVENIFQCASCYTIIGKVRDRDLDFIPLSIHPPLPSTGEYKECYKKFRREPIYDKHNNTKYGYVCAGCLHVRYCSEECQVNHWHSHKAYCRLVESQGRHFHRGENDNKKDFILIERGRHFVKVKRTLP